MPVHVNTYTYIRRPVPELNSKLPIVVYFRNAISAERKVATVGEFDWIPVPFCVLVVTTYQSFRFCFHFQKCWLLKVDTFRKKF